MPEQGTEFFEQYQTLMQQGWDAWSRQLQANGTATPASADSSAVNRMFDGLKGYGDWLQSVAGGSAAGEPLRWPDMPAGLTGMPPFGQPAAGTGDSSETFAKQMETWLTSTRALLGMPAFGIGREQQEEQQALLRAAIDYAEQQARYQALLARVHAQGVEALERYRVEHIGTDTGPESLRALYDLWVGLTEEAYAKAALSDEFREVYASLANAQMHLRLLQQRQVERLAVQAGMPTRSEVNSMGERLQAMRRELRKLSSLSREVASLREEVAALKSSGTKSSVKKPMAVKTAKAAPGTKTARVTRS
jgi:class III poly(R)-hydroxyalkanoic acid synthase PhaE subunit